MLSVRSACSTIDAVRGHHADHDLVQTPALTALYKVISVKELAILVPVGRRGKREIGHWFGGELLSSAESTQVKMITTRRQDKVTQSDRRDQKVNP